ncbi:MAG TPA: transcriptional regulator GcvA [Pseudolabrys sp.]|nr:transcriptional regulator GcvA [Pseudolabrys sp.]
MRRHLPPLNAVRAFEAAARHNSFTRAATELCVTQGAVSRHVAALEQHFATRLFVRRHRAIDLTPAGHKLLAAFGEALDRIELAAHDLRAAAEDKTLRVTLPPTFAIRWIVPRLARLHALDARLNVQITTSHSPPDFAGEGVDVAIYSGPHPPKGLDARKLFGEMLLPVCSPKLTRGPRALRRPADLLDHVLMYSMHRPNDWRNWSAVAGLSELDLSKGLTFENSALAYQAAIDGVGVAIAQKSLIQDDLAYGRLVAPFAVEAPNDWAYYIIRPKRAPARSHVKVFEDWVIKEAVTQETTVPGEGSRRAAPVDTRLSLAQGVARS